jgi:hypothetical protein
MLRAILASLRSPWLFHRVGAAILFFFAAAASFNGFQDISGFANDAEAYPPYGVSFIGAITSTAQKPFVFRRMLPDIANWTTAITPRPLQDRLHNWFYPSVGPDLHSKILSFGRSDAAQSRTWFFPYLVLYICQFLSTLLAVIAMHLLCRAMGLQPAVTLFAPVIVILIVPYIFSAYYDCTELALFFLAAWLALRFRWWWLLPIAALGAWNKESFLFFIPTLYPFLRMRASRKTSLAAVVVLCALCGLIYLHALSLFAHNANTGAWLQWKTHFSDLLNSHAQLFVNDEVYGIRILRVSTLAPTLLLIWALARAWKHLSVAVRRHTFIAAAINFPLYLLFGNGGEYRNLSMLSIFFLLAVAWNLEDGLKHMECAQPVSGKV